jgi:hypothetical protein
MSGFCGLSLPLFYSRERSITNLLLTVIRRSGVQIYLHQRIIKILILEARINSKKLCSSIAEKLPDLLISYYFSCAHILTQLSSLKFPITSWESMRGWNCLTRDQT